MSLEHPGGGGVRDPRLLLTLPATLTTDGVTLDGTLTVRSGS